MCETAQGLELTRLTVIDNDHAVVLDTLVKPKNRITNYLTKYSGMTEELLQSVTVTLEQAQIAFMRLIPKETILIGKLKILGSVIYVLLFHSESFHIHWFKFNFCHFWLKIFFKSTYV